MIVDARYVHTNLIARDWRTLARFYEVVFGCELVPPQRKFAGPDLEVGTGVPNAAIEGVHLRLPGHGPSGPTIEIFSYSQYLDHLPPVANRLGFAHIAFAVPSVPAARDEVLAAGGAALGDIVTLTTAIGAEVTWCYVRDPEGNIVELQTWR